MEASSVPSPSVTQFFSLVAIAAYPFLPEILWKYKHTCDVCIYFNLLFIIQIKSLPFLDVVKSAAVNFFYVQILFKTITLKDVEAGWRLWRRINDLHLNFVLPHKICRWPNPVTLIAWGRGAGSYQEHCVTTVASAEWTSLSLLFSFSYKMNLIEM